MPKLVKIVRPSSTLLAEELYPLCFARSAAVALSSLLVSFYACFRGGTWVPSFIPTQRVRGYIVPLSYRGDRLFTISFHLGNIKRSWCRVELPGGGGGSLRCC